MRAVGRAPRPAVHRPAAGAPPAACARPTIATRRRCFDRARRARRPTMLYVVGGLYGNLAALEAIEATGRARARAASQSCSTATSTGSTPSRTGSPQSSAASRAIVALRGNVETEIARDGDIGAGCGCAYPAASATRWSQRSNEILSALRAQRAARHCARDCAALPMHLVARVGGLRVGIVHGDAAALAGWGFAHDALDDPARAPLARRRSAPQSGSTSSPRPIPAAALRDFALPGGRLTDHQQRRRRHAELRRRRRSGSSRASPRRPSPHEPLYGLRARRRAYRCRCRSRYDRDGFPRPLSWRAGRRARRRMLSYFRAHHRAGPTTRSGDRAGAGSAYMTLFHHHAGARRGGRHRRRARGACATARARRRGDRRRRRQPRRHGRRAPRRSPTA